MPSGSLQSVQRAAPGSGGGMLQRFNDLGLRSKILLAFAGPLTLMLGLATIAIYNTGKIQHTSHWVDHTRVVLAEADTIVGAAVDMETGMRGYLLAGRETFLEPYRSGEAAAYDTIASLQQTVSDNPPQVARLGEVEAKLRAWQRDVAEPQIALRREIGDAETMNDMAALVREARGKTYFDAIRAQLATFQGREEALLEERRATLHALSGAAESWQKRDALQWVEHTYKVIAAAEDLLGAAVDMETGMRGFLLAGDEVFLEPLESGGARFDAGITQLQETVSDNPPQVALLKEVEAKVAAWRADVVVPMIELRRAIGTAKTMDDMADLIAEARGKTYFDAFRALMAEFIAEEEKLIAVRLEANEATVSSTFIWIAVFTAIAIVVGLSLGWLVSGATTRPLKSVTEAMHRLAGGDPNTNVVGIERKDEVGDVARAAVQVFEAQGRQRREISARLADSFEAEMGKVVATVADAAVGLERTATGVKSAATTTSQQTVSVASAAQEASQNVQTVATAAEEMSASVRDISQQLGESERIAGEAGEAAGRVQLTINELVETASKIGNVVKLISAIAEQTNLLSLNATIEAARAGDAGRGFAVVAQEVKALAGETAKATQEISSQISELQSVSNATAGDVASVGQVIQRMTEIAGSIAAGMQEQSAATDEIAQNVQEAARGNAEVSQIMEHVAKAAGDGDNAANDLAQAATALNANAAVLDQKVRQFVDGLRAA